MYRVLSTTTLIVVLAMQAEAFSGEVLYNGIELPDQWPPRINKLVLPMAVPYLKTPPKVIPIDVGRQLFVDDFLIESSTLKRSFHQSKYHPASPVIKPDKPGQYTYPFSDGVWFDHRDKRFKAWYMDEDEITRYAVSRDGVRWEKPDLGVVPGTNMVVKHKTPDIIRRGRDSSTVWLDHEEKDPQARFKMFCTEHKKGWKNYRLAYYTSADGVHWAGPLANSPAVGDRTTVFYNPFRKVWVFSLRPTGDMLKAWFPAKYGGFSEVRGYVPRVRGYYETPDLKSGLQWTPANEYLWIGADDLDPRHPVVEFAEHPQLYNLDGVAYESLMLGLFSVWEGPENPACRRLCIQKRNEVLLGFSRDGFHWDRPDRKPFAGVNEKLGAWNWGNVQSTGGGCLVVGDKLYFYVSGRALADDPTWKGSNTTGLAVIRRDGFASMDAGVAEGVLTTRPVTFRGKHLFVNLAASEGELRVEVLSEQGQTIEPFTRANCLPIQGDKPLLPVRWNGAADLSSLVGKPVKFRFYLKDGSLYAFWVSPEQSGASHGYVAAGGPGFTGPTDTVGSAANKPVSVNPEL